MDHKFTGPSYTIGIEEELMILDAETLELANASRRCSRTRPRRGEIKPELHESVLEIATEPCRTTAEAAEQLRGLRAAVREKAAARGYTIGSAGTHPFAMWEDQRIVARPRYRDLICALRFVARQEIIFGMHVHVGVDDPDDGDPRGQRHARARTRAAGAVGQLAVLARGRDRPGLHAHADLPRLPARGHPAALRVLGRLRRARSSSWSTPA